VTIPNPDHLLEQAARLAAGRPRQAELRRAISTAYYRLFHFCLAAVADKFVGKTQRKTSRYALVYRGIAHRTLRELCVEARKQKAASRYTQFIPDGGFSPGLHIFATGAMELQDSRHSADYDPQSQFDRREAQAAIQTARSAIEQFRAAPEDHRKLFLTLLLSPPR
jgi:uncharacterized protein (UPF0332 family)